MKKKRLIIGVILFCLISSVSAHHATCNSCEDCSNKLAEGGAPGDEYAEFYPYESVSIDSDLYASEEEDCISFNLPFQSTVTIDCEGHSINGIRILDEDGWDVYPTRGINIYNDEYASNARYIIKNCTITGFATGIRAHNIGRFSLQDSYIAENGEGVNIFDLEDVTIEDNIINFNDWGGIGLSGMTSSEIEIINNTLYGNRYISVLCEQFYDALISGNLIYNTLDYETEYPDESSPALGLEVTEGTKARIINNEITDNEGIGLYFGVIKNVQIYNNEIYDNEYSGSSSLGDYVFDITHVEREEDNSEPSLSGSGNTCDTTYKWDDEGVTGCTYKHSYQLDLGVYSSGISFSSNAPNAGDTLNINVELINGGWMETEDILLRFYDGPPQEGVLIGEQTIDYMSGYSRQTITQQWQPTAGEHNVYVVADPQDMISESDEDNNEASKNIIVYQTPEDIDLVIYGSEITFTKRGGN